MFFLAGSSGLRAPGKWHKLSKNLSNRMITALYRNHKRLAKSQKQVFSSQTYARRILPTRHSSSILLRPSQLNLYSTVGKKDTPKYSFQSAYPFPAVLAPLNVVYFKDLFTPDEQQALLEVRVFHSLDL